MKNITLGIILNCFIISVNAQFSDGKLNPFRIDSASYLSELKVSNHPESYYLFKKNNEQLFRDSFASRFKKGSSQKGNSNVVKTKTKIKSPKKIDRENLVFLDLNFPRITEIIINELEDLRNSMRQKIFQMRLLDAESKVTENSILKKGYLMDSVETQYVLIPNGNIEDPSDYKKEYIQSCKMKPFELFIRMKVDKPYLEFRFSDNSLKSLFIDPVELPKEYKNIQFLLGSKYFNNYVSENAAESDTYSLKYRISTFLNKDEFYYHVPLEAIKAKNFHWIYMTEERGLSDPMDLEEFQYNASYLHSEYLLLPDKDPADPENYKVNIVFGAGELGVSNDPQDVFKTESVSLIQEFKFDNQEENPHFVGLLFNYKTAIMFDDSIEEFPKNDIDFFVHLYKMSYSLR